MLKRVKIKMISERHELQGSLFEGGGVREKGRAEPPQRMESRTDAAYLDDGVRISISYNETAESGLQGSRATLAFRRDEPQVLHMTRSGSVKTALLFETGRLHSCVYQTPIMPFEVCVLTTEVCNRLEQEGRLVLDYHIELRGAAPEHTHLTLEILPEA